MIQQLGYNNPGKSIGVLGIVNSDGSYMYYPDYTSAMASAKSGDTITQFANIIEYKNVIITLKDNVNINLNGFIYEMKAAGSYFSAGAVTCSMMGGRIISNSAGNALIINNSSANITTNCVYSGNITINQGKIDGGIVFGTLTCNNLGSIDVRSIYVNSSSSYAGIFSVNSTTINVYNSTFISSATYAGAITSVNGTAVNLHSCIFFSSAGVALGSTNPSIYAKTYNCLCISTASGAWANIYGGGIHINLTAISTAAAAIYSNSGVFYNVFGYSSASNALGGAIGFQISGSYASSYNTFYGGRLTSLTAAISASSNNNGETNRGDSFIKTTLDCQWNSPLAHCAVNASMVVGCYIILVNRKANAIKSIPNLNNAYITYVARNIFQGMEKPIADNVILRQNNQVDLYGNIKIG